MNRITDYKQLATDISAWIRDYATTNNIKSLVVGVSGGIDSAVVSTLCAMTGIDTHLLCIDIRNDSANLQTPDDHINHLMSEYKNVSGRRFSIDDTLTGIYNEVGIVDEHTIANTKSRLRMVALYHVAGWKKGIVVGTGNKVEDFGIGFFTKYGDGGVDISPIADLYKTEVRELGRYLGIADEILNAAPTDGLWSDNRTDEQQIGCIYEELEWFMSTGHAITPSELTERQVQIAVTYSTLHNRNQHKMQPIPIYKLNL